MKHPFLKHLQVQELNPGTLPEVGEPYSTDTIESVSPIDGTILGKVSVTTHDEYRKLVDRLKGGFTEWSLMPAPQRGDIIRQYGNLLRENKEELGKLVSVEMGKSLQ